LTAAGSVKDGFHHIDGAELLIGCLKKRNMMIRNNKRTPIKIHTLISGLSSMVLCIAGDEAM
jgi:hypothetical protein